MPSQPIATCASRKTIVGKYAAALVFLNDVINFPVTGEVAVFPAALVQVHWVATEVAMTFGLLPNQSQFGFQLVGGDGGNAFISFFKRDGSLISTVTVSGLANSFYGFQRDGGVQDIAGISIYNDDTAGIGFDNLKHDVVSTVPGIPEPGTYALMLAGLGVVGFVARRRKVAA